MFYLRHEAFIQNLQYEEKGDRLLIGYMEILVELEKVWESILEKDRKQKTKNKI